MPEKYLRCPRCGLTLLAAEAGGPDTTRKAPDFEHIAHHSWRCANCGYEGAMKELISIGEVRPRELIVSGEASLLNLDKDYLNRKTKKMQAWSLFNRLANLGVPVDPVMEDIDELSRATKDVLAKVNRKLLRAIP